MAVAMVSMTGGGAFENRFREFLQEPDTQDAIRDDQRKELEIMKKMDDMEKLEELQGQREQLAIALQAARARQRPYPSLAPCRRRRWHVCRNCLPRLSGSSTRSCG